MALGPLLFKDVDGSEIYKSNEPVVTHAHYVISPPTTGKFYIETVFFDKLNVDALLDKLTFMVNQPIYETNGFVVCGFDTETGANGGLELILLSVGNFVVLIRRCLFQVDFLKGFFRNELFPEKRIVFCGAELASADALDMLEIGFSIDGLLDLTSVLSQNHGDNDFGRPKFLSLHLSDNDASSISLRRMLIWLSIVTGTRTKQLHAATGVFPCSRQRRSSTPLWTRGLGPSWVVFPSSSSAF